MLFWRPCCQNGLDSQRATGGKSMSGGKRGQKLILQKGFEMVLWGVQKAENASLSAAPIPCIALTKHE